MSADPAEQAFHRAYDAARRDDFSGALDSYCEALRLQPDNAAIHRNIGVILSVIQRWDDAVVAFQKALALDPDLDQVHYALGLVLRSQGKFDPAADAFRTAIRLAPRNGLYYRALVQVTTLPPDGPHIGAIAALLEAPETLSLDDRIALEFALAHALAEQDDPKAAFTHALRGNRLKRQTFDYDVTQSTRHFARIAEAFPAETLHTPFPGASPSDVPIFIVGMPRSGTSLVEQILASHPAVAGIGEQQLIHRALGGVNLLGTASMDGGWRAEFAETYLTLLHYACGDRGPVRHIVDKDLDTVAHVGLIHQTFPKARFIHCRRSPIDTCLSCFSRYFEHIPYSYDLGELGQYYRAYHGLMTHWAEVLPPGVMIEVRYEDLIADQAGETRRMLDHCGLDWDPACLDFHRTERIVRTESAVQVRQPLYQSVTPRWRQNTDSLAPLLAEIGDLD